MRRPLICANWKMNHTLDSGIEFFERLAGLYEPVHADAVVFPPFPIISPLHEYAEGIGVYLGGQNINENQNGAFTGEVSTEILKSVGASHVIVGHSERRDIYNEDDDLISKKLKISVSSKLVTILCVGEHKETRQQGKTIDYIKNQLEIDLKELGNSDFELISIAYEPIWAIGTGDAATPDDADEIMSFIRQWLNEKYNDITAENCRILYGGSVKPENMGEFASKYNIDGALVGGASLEAESFASIINEAVKAKNT